MKSSFLSREKMEFSEMSKQQQFENADHSLHLANVGIHTVQDTKPLKKRRVTYKCKICDKSFRTLSVCQAHTSLHGKNSKPSDTGLRIFHCRLCNTNHRGLTAFLEHQNFHEDFKPYQQEFDLIANQNGAQQQASSSADDHQEVIVTTSDGRNIQLTTTSDESNNQDTDNNGDFTNVQQSLLSNTVGLTADQLSTISLPASIMAVLCTAVTPSTNTPPNHSSVTTNCKTVSSDGLHVNIPNHVKSIYFNSTNPPLSELAKQLDILNQKVDIIMKHLSIPFDEDGNPISIATTSQTDMDVDPQTKDLSADESNSTIMLENFPPSYSVVQAAKEQQQQEYYALQLSNRQAQQTYKQSDSTHILTGTTSKNAKGIDIWVPSQQYLTQISSLTDQQSNDSEDGLVEIDNPIIQTQIVDKVFVESRSRANFAKNLTFAVFTAEERRGKNCTGRVFGKAQHKGQLDQLKLNAVKEATFRKYPCRPDLTDMTWRKECVTAIDSGLRNEHRSATKLPNMLHHQHQMIDTSGNEEMMSKI